LESYKIQSTGSRMRHLNAKIEMYL
jgi:hypothetical protein